MNVQKVSVMLVLLILLITPARPAWALSDLAEDFIFWARQPDISFPPEDWSDEDVRDGALEVLDAFENGESEDWTVHFCLIALGHTRNPEDVPRILNYEDTMTGAVLRSIRGFPAPDAIECMIRQLTAERASFRELAIKALRDVEYDLLDEPDVWRDAAVEALETSREVEEHEPLAELMDEAIEIIRTATVVSD